MSITKGRAPALLSAVEEYFGKHWFPKCMFLMVFVLWPLLVFSTDIQFAADRFVEEWIKLTTQGLLLLFALEVLDRRARTLRIDEAASRWIQENLARRAEHALAIIEAYRTAPPAADRDRKDMAATALSSFDRLAESLTPKAIRENVDRLRAVTIQAAAAKYAPTRQRRQLEELLPAGRTMATPTDSALRNISAALRQLLDSLP